MPQAKRSPARPAAPRKQGERSAHTRRLLLEAAIDALYRQGYAATTTMLVAERGGVSRGRILHHFPTKTDLMIFVVESVYAEEIERYSEMIVGGGDYEEVLLAYTDAAWKILSRPSGLAVLEILQGSRSDEDLAAKLRPAQARIEADARRRVQKHLVGGGSPELMRLVVWSIRGLSIGMVLLQDPSSMANCVALMRQLISAGVATGVLGPKKKETAARKSKGAVAKGR